MGLVGKTSQGTEYAGGGYRVVVRDDGAIHVQTGDSLSKYSMAIYGDFNNMDKKFGRMVGGKVKSFRELGANPNRILIGETVYQMNRARTGGGSGGGDEDGVLVNPGTPPVERSEMSKRIEQALRYFRQVQSPLTDWELKGSDGIAIGGGSPGIKFGGSLSAFRFWVQRPQDAQLTTMRAITVGATAGFNPDPIPVDVTFAHHTFPSIGAIAKGYGAGLTLSKSELSGAIVTIGLSGHVMAGVSAIFVMGGPGIVEFFTSPVVSTGRLFAPKWFIMSAGFDLKFDADVGASINAGYLYAS